MPQPSTSFAAVSPAPPRVVSIGHGIFEIPTATGTPFEFTVPTNYNLFVGNVAPDNADGTDGDWFVYNLTSLVRVYRKQSGSWALITVISGTAGGDVGGPASSGDGDIALFDGLTGKLIKDSVVTIAASAGTATSTQVPRGNDPRMTNSRVPTAHATTHQAGGSDPIKLDLLAAPTDVTTLDSTTGAHGLLPKLSGVSNHVLKGDGSFSTLGAVTGSGILMASSSILGRTTVGTGAVEEISVGSGLSLSAGSLTATGLTTYGFRAVSASTQTTTVSASTQIVFGSELYDPNSVFASSSFTVPATGFYNISCSVDTKLTSGTPTITFLTLELMHGGTAVDRDTILGPDYISGQTMKISGSYSMTAGDVYFVQVRSSFAGAGTFSYFSGQETNFSGFRIA